MKKFPSVSVIISTYNRDKYLARAIKSVLTQTFKDLELIIIDDSTHNRIASFVNEIFKKDSRVIYIKNKIRLGFIKSLNRGIELAKGEYIARLDDDDYWVDPEKLQKQVKFLKENPDYILTGGGVIIIDEKNREIDRRLPPQTHKEIINAMLFNCPFWHSTVVFKKEAWEKAGKYNEKIEFSDDWDLWLRMGKYKLGKFYNFPEYFTCYLEWEQNKTIFILRPCLRFNLKLRIKYRKDYPNFYKALIINLVRYFYFYLPPSLQKFLRPPLSKIKRLIFRTPY
ncbi:glycosyltransferase [bacterium]|nr:glycosyltransferase [bacterium]